jgi:hypothetical protein
VPCNESPSSVAQATPAQTHSHPHVSAGANQTPAARPLLQVKPPYTAAEQRSALHRTTLVSGAALALFGGTLHQHPSHPGVLCINQHLLLRTSSEQAARHLLWLRKNIWEMVERRTAAQGLRGAPAATARVGDRRLAEHDASVLRLAREVLEKTRSDGTAGHRAAFWGGVGREEIEKRMTNKEVGRNQSQQLHAQRLLRMCKFCQGSDSRGQWLRRVWGFVEAQRQRDVRWVREREEEQKKERLRKEEQEQLQEQLREQRLKEQRRQLRQSKRKRKQIVQRERERKAAARADPGTS